MLIKKYSNAWERTCGFEVSEEKQTCITHHNDCEDCERIFDDDLSTSSKLDSRDGIYPKMLEINQTCVNTSDVSGINKTTEL